MRTLLYYCRNYFIKGAILTRKRATIKDVAEKAGVSPSTVSRVVGSYGYVKKSTRNKIQRVIVDLDYKPNTLARSMITKSTKTIGVIVTDITNPFFASVIRSIEDVLWESGYTILLANTDENVEREKIVITEIMQRQVDGIILVPSTSKKKSHLDLIVNQGIPLILVDRMVEDLSVDSILVDNEYGAFTAVSHMIQKGHTCIGMVIDNLNISTNNERLDGYKKAITSSGLIFDPGLIKSCKFTSKSAFELVSQMLSDSNRPSALFGANNFMTLGILQAIVKADLRIPNDISLVGFDDISWFSSGSQQVSTVSQPVHDIGSIAAKRIISRLNGDYNPPMEIRLETRFIDRGSCSSLK